MGNKKEEPIADLGEDTKVVLVKAKEAPVVYTDPRALQFENDEVAEAINFNELPRVTFTADRQNLVMRFTGGETKTIVGPFGCIVHGSSKKRALYTEKYEEDSKVGPVCVSLQGEKGQVILTEGGIIPFLALGPEKEKVRFDGGNEPDTRSGKPLTQGTPSCTGCYYDRWGSITEFGREKAGGSGRGKACNEQRLVLVTVLGWVDDLNKWRPLSGFAILQIPPTGLGGWSAFVQKTRMMAGNLPGSWIKVSPTAQCEHINLKKRLEVKKVRKPPESLVISFLDWTPGINDQPEEGTLIDEEGIPF